MHSFNEYKLLISWEGLVVDGWQRSQLNLKMQDNDTNGYGSSESDTSEILEKEEEELFSATTMGRNPHETGKLVYHVNATIELKEPATRFYSRGERAVFESQDF